MLFCNIKSSESAKVFIGDSLLLIISASGSGARPRDSSISNGPDRSLGEQAASLTSPIARISALRRTTHALRVTMARAVVMRALSLLALSGGSCDLWAGLEALGLCDVRLLVRLMWLVAQGKVLFSASLPKYGFLSLYFWKWRN